MYNVINCWYISILCDRYIHMYSKSITNVKIIQYLYFIISFRKRLFFITICYTQKQWLWAFRFRFLSTAFNVRLAECCLVAQQQVVKSCVSDHLPFWIISSCFFLVDLLSHFKLNPCVCCATDARFLLMCYFKWTSFSLPSPSSMSQLFEPTLGTFDFRFLWQCLSRCSLVTNLVFFLQIRNCVQ